MWRYQRGPVWGRPPFVALVGAALCLVVPLLNQTVLSHPDVSTNNSVPVTAQAPPDSQNPLPQAAATEQPVLPGQTDVQVNLPVPQPPQPVPQTGDCTTIPCIALSFDDGPNPDSTAKILDALAQAQVKASFFLIGNRIINNGALVQRMAREGHDIGNHSWNHADFIKLKPDQISQEINDTQTAVTNLGLPAPFMFRPPYGDLNSQVRAQVQLAIVRWNVDPRDWAQTDPNAIDQSVESQAKPGAIILLHDKVSTATAIAKIVTDLKAKYHIVPVSQLLNIGPGAKGEFVGR